MTTQPPSSSGSSDLVVLGGGPAGLAAAWRAASRGIHVTLLERAPTVGGMAASIEVAGFRVDRGSHRLHPATPPDVMADLRSLLGEDLQTRPRNGRLRVDSRWVGFPLRATELARSLPPRMLAGVARDALTAPLRRTQEDTYAGVLRAGLGPTLYDALYAPYAEKLWGLPGERISGDQARKRVTADTPWKVAARVVRGRRGTGQGQVFHYPRRGFGQIVDALADAATAAGARIVTGAEVDRLVVRRDGVVAHTRAGLEVAARRAFSTVPLPVLSRITSPGAPLSAVEAAGRLSFRAMVLVYLVHEGGRWSPYDAHYVPGPETPVTRISEPANYRDSADDPTDRTVLCAEIPCARGDAVWSSSDEDLAATVDVALAATGLPPVRRTAVFVERMPNVYPVYATGYEWHLSGLDAWARSLPTVTTFGRLGLFAHDNTHHALTMAYDAVDALNTDGWDARAWAQARERFAAHVVED
ncbi:MAG: FAD-dependent oxidoreductase [Actinomycetota bacterium]|nr:FAD-dependent oxidoreductase [Actinomycetota bacterium]